MVALLMTGIILICLAGRGMGDIPTTRRRIRRNERRNRADLKRVLRR